MVNDSSIAKPAVESDKQLSRVVRLFQEEYGKGVSARVFQAPGRVNLIGEHTDYNDGFVMPAAIDFNTWVAAAPREDGKLVVRSADFAETVSFDANEASPSSRHHWSDYVRGVFLELRRCGVGINGASLLVSGNVPIGAGLSSSASIEVATAFALQGLFGSGLNSHRIATLCQRAENEFVGMRCGIMDQFVSVHGKSDHALMLDCRSLDYELLPLPPTVSLVICNTMVKHQLASGEYNIRRRECEEGVARLQEEYPQVRALRDVTPEMLKGAASLMSETVYRRCRHVVEEDERVKSAAAALRARDLGKLGKLMYASHASLRDDYAVSCTELNIMVELASRGVGIIGARMTGGGFGGCTINLVENAAVEPFCAMVAGEYENRTGIKPEIYVTRASDGASEIFA